MNLPRRQFLQLAASAAAFATFPSLAAAETYPARPVRILVGYTPGGSTDVIARVIGRWLAERLGQPVVIENRPGAGANIATETVVRATADGYTLLLVNSADTINPNLYRKLNFTFMRDIAPVASIARQPQVMLASPSIPAQTLSDLIAYARANPGKLTMASPGNGSIGHLSGEMLKMMTGVDLVHVPYRGTAPTLTDLLAGHVQISFNGLAGSLEFIRTGKLRALAVTTATRSNALPDIPAVNEFVPGYEAVSLFGIGAPKNTPAEIVDKLNREINAALVDAKIATQIADMGGTVLASSSADFARLLVGETEKWGKVIQAANIAPV